MKNETVRQQLREKWGIDPRKMWLPLIGRLSADTIYFEYNVFEQQFGVAQLQNLLPELGEKSWWAISEVGEDKSGVSAEVKSFAHQSQIEMYYCNATPDWVVYISHENTIALAGKALLDHLKRAWPDFVSYCNPWE
ncbi:hypothetical protein [Hymenobacter sp. UYCo722]|uniref:hypothetical protein n=1 Tax=Hymenobacter sp. UYCo722 TaxID=3156335 RepID=UPI0033930A63